MTTAKCMSERMYNFRNHRYKTTRHLIFNPTLNKIIKTVKSSKLYMMANKKSKDDFVENST